MFIGETMRRQGTLMATCILSIFLVPTSILFSDLDTAAPVIGPTYHSSSDISALLSVLSNADPDLTEYTTAQELLDIRDIPGGREIPILFLGDERENRPWVMLVGAHHGDEPDSAEAVLGFAQFMVNAYGDGDQRARDILDNVNIAVLPVVNPYGLDTGSRYDENGEDPNRDYPFAPADAGPHADGTPLTTAGAMTVHTLASIYPFSVALSFHTGSEGIYTPWGAPSVGNVTPDGNCFMDMAYVLKRASGRSLPYGPANDFGYLGNLKGAMEDHLYGSTFLSDRLFTPDMALPWSSFTATVELLNRKGQDPDMLGTLEGVMDPGGPEDGTLPMGVRISIAACMMASPSMRGTQTRGDDGCSIDLVMTGTASTGPVLASPRSDISMVGTHEFLPERYYSGQWDRPDHGAVILNISTVPDPSWPMTHPDADPALAPVSLLSHSRGVAGSPRELSLNFVLEGGSEPAPILPTVAVGEVLPERPEVSSMAFIELTIDPMGATMTGLTINASCGGTWSLTDIEGGDVIIGSSWYPYELPMASGPTRLDMTLLTDRGDVSAVGMVMTEHRIYILTLTTDVNDPNTMRLLVGVEGTYEPIILTYGIIRERYDGATLWVMGPYLHTYSTANSGFIDMNVSGLGGDLTFVVCRADGTMTDSRDHYIERDVRIVGATMSRTGDVLALGPALIVQNANGMAPVETYDNIVNFEVEVLKDGRTYYSGNLHFVPRRVLGPEMTEALNDLVTESGLDPEQVHGCYVEYVPVPSGSAMMDAEFHAWGGIMTPEDMQSMNFDTGYVDSEPLSVEVEERDEEGNFPWSILIFIVIVAMFVLVITIMRYNAHWREPEPDYADLPPHRMNRPLAPHPEGRSGRTDRRPTGPFQPRARTLNDERTGGGSR